MNARTITAALALLACGTARAGNAPGSITISGGVSLGAYEAGLVHYAIEAMRLNPAAASPKIVTGASAGSVNGFMTILQSCGTPVDDPTKGLFWNAWIPLGLEKLHDPAKQGKTSAFSRDAFAEPLRLIIDSWKAGLPESCDVVYGLSVTRLVPRTLQSEGDRLQLPRVEEHFVVRVQGRGAGKAPRLTNYVDPSWDGDQVLLAEKGGEVIFEGLVDALFASTAFPGAFPPQAVRTCVVKNAKRPVTCPAEEARLDYYVDGGVFDNTPVRLATRYAAAGLRVDAEGTARWLDRPDLSRRDIPEQLAIAYVSTEARTFPAPDSQPAQAKLESILGVAAQVGGSFYSTARAKNLVYVQEDAPDVFARLLVPQRHLPAASSPFGAFFGFFETELRKFDFALGMYDGRKLAEERIEARLAKDGKPGTTKFPDETPGARKAAAAWKPYTCLRAVVEYDPAAPAACEGEDIRDFRVVLQSSLERLWDRCVRLGPTNTSFDAHRLCRNARAGGPLPAVPFVKAIAGEAWRRGETENEAGYLMRLLAAHEFQFKDLGLERDQADQAPAALRTRLLALGDSIAKTQPGGEGLILGTLVKMAADEVAYVPPKFTAWAMYGRDPEVGLSKGFRSAGSLVAPVRFLAALQFVGASQALSSEDGDTAFNLMLGVEYLPSWWASTRLQPSILLRAGWLFGMNDDGGFSSCPDVENSAIGHCSRPSIQGGVSATLIERIRLQLTANVYPPTQTGEKLQWAIGPGIGYQWGF